MRIVLSIIHLVSYDKPVGWVFQPTIGGICIQSHSCRKAQHNHLCFIKGALANAPYDNIPSSDGFEVIQKTKLKYAFPRRA